jgi:hypothetical protein
MFLSGVQSCQEAEFLLFQGTSHFSLKVFNWLDETNLLHIK